MTKLKLAFLCLILLVTPARADDLQPLRIAVLKTGTVNWELDTIRHFNLDTENGFRLELRSLAGNPATRIAFQGGEADVVVADWLWVARQRAAGKDYVFIPYSKAVGGLMVATDSNIDDLTDLAGQKIGIAGGAVDKSWLILQAYAKHAYQIDLAQATEQAFGAPPLIMQAGISGEVAGVINFWHFQAKLATKGFHELISVSEAAEALGLDPQTPLLGYVVKRDLIQTQPDLVRGLAKASRMAKNLLATDDTAWSRLRPVMRAETDAEFEALKAGFRAGIPTDTPIELAAAERLFDLMVSLGGEKLMGDATHLPKGIFYQGD